MLVFDILKNPSEVNIIEQTEWLDEDSNIDSLYEAYKQKYEIITSKLIQEIGQIVNNEHKFIKDFYLYLIEYNVFK